MGNNQNIQVAELNQYVKTRLAPSKVHGVGVFALRDIAKGQKLYADIFTKIYTLPHSSFGKLFPEVALLLLERWPLIMSGSHFAWPDCRIVAYMNHSDAPNYDAVKDVMLEDVKEGEEIFEDYRKIEGWERIHIWLVDRSKV